MSTLTNLVNTDWHAAIARPPYEFFRSVIQDGGETIRNRNMALWALLFAYLAKCETGEDVPVLTGTEVSGFTQCLETLAKLGSQSTHDALLRRCQAAQCIDM